MQQIDFSGVEQPLAEVVPLPKRAPKISPTSSAPSGCNSISYSLTDSLSRSADLRGRETYRVENKGKSYIRAEYTDPAKLEAKARELIRPLVEALVGDDRKPVWRLCVNFLADAPAEKRREAMAALLRAFPRAVAVGTFIVFAGSGEKARAVLSRWDDTLGFADIEQPLRVVYGRYHNRPVLLEHVGNALLAAFVRWRKFGGDILIRGVTDVWTTTTEANVVALIDERASSRRAAKTGAWRAWKPEAACPHCRASYRVVRADQTSCGAPKCRKWAHDERKRVQKKGRDDRPPSRSGRPSVTRGGSIPASPAARRALGPRDELESKRNTRQAKRDEPRDRSG